MTTSIHVIVSGKVQGVAYRAWTAGEAEKNGLSGWIRNRDDGKVEAVLAGEDMAVSDMVARLWQGPPAARVSDVDARSWSDEVPAGFTVL